ncbi:UDP-glucosyltransferase 2 [Megachile rotundata]|uniref:UDP-glucosyltransferase 2 n=1 Tax=Megachile rotundata TaxID=143995 RepID=UPI003FD18BC8
MRLLLTVLAAVLTFGQSTEGLRILGLFPLNGRSHWIMGERLLTSLAERGHTVDVVTHFTVKEPPANYTEISLEGTIESVVNKLELSHVVEFNNQNFELLTRMVGDQICKLMEYPKLKQLIDNPPKDPPYDLVIVEMFLASCYLAFGRHLNVPMVGVVTAGSDEWFTEKLGNPFNPSFVPSLFTSYDQKMNFWQRLMNTFLTNMVAFQLDRYVNPQQQYVQKYFGINATITDLYHDLDLLLVNSHHSLLGIRPLTMGIVEVGGLHVKDDGKPLPADLQKWLDESKHGCILFTFGSMVRIETFPESLLRSVYKVFEKIAPVRVLMKVGKKEELLPGLPKNVMTKPWFPQVAVLKHKNTKAFITHGGLMGLQESVHFGVPLVGIPLYGDQHGNLDSASKKLFAVNLRSFKEVNEKTLGDAINTVLYNETYRANIKKVSELFKDRPMSAVDTAIYWIEYVARHGKILQSPAIHLSWWQVHLFDVYGFMLACIVLILYVFVLLVRKLKRKLLGSSCDHKSKKSSNSKKNK